jgi:hypothetical protein
MPGWELRVTRLGVQQKQGSTPPARTYGSYQVYIDDAPVQGLSGNICERRGRGDNTHNGVASHSRIAAGTYPLSTQFGRYRSVNYSDGATDETHPPAFRVMNTGARTAILVHPAHRPHLYLSSIGCFNPTRPLGDADDMDFTESRARVIAMLDSLRQHDAAAFERHNVGTNTPIANASLVITGEPMGAVPTA